MAGGVEYLKLQSPHSQSVTLVVEIHAAEGDTGQFTFQREQLGLRIVEIGLVNINGSLGHRLQKPGDAAGVVIVAVGQQDLIHGAVQLFGGREDQLRLRTGIDHGAGMGIFVTENIAVGADGTNL